MGAVSDFFVNLLNFNEGLNFAIILSCMVVYLLFFWYAVSYWVYKDALKRYKNKGTAFKIAFGVFFLFFPALILYVAARKPHSDDHFDVWDLSDTGVNVPIVNFKGDRGISMTLELNINPKSFENPGSSDMKVDVNWVSQKDSFEEDKTASNSKPADDFAAEKDFIDNIKSKLDSGKQRIKGFLNGLKKKSEEKKDDAKEKIEEKTEQKTDNNEGEKREESNHEQNQNNN